MPISLRLVAYSTRTEDGLLFSQGLIPLPGYIFSRLGTVLLMHLLASFRPWKLKDAHNALIPETHYDISRGVLPECLHHMQVTSC